MIACASIPPACRSSAARWLLALVVGRGGRLAAGAAVRRPRRVLPLLLPRSRSRVAVDRRRRAVAGRRPRAGGRAGRRRSRAARVVAADQHLPVADGRARQPHAGVRARDAVSYHARPVPAGLPPRRRRRRTSAARSGSITTARRSSRGRSSACWRAASSAASQPGADVRAGDRYGIMKFGSRMDVFLPLDGRRFAVKVGDMVRGGETVIAVLH